MNANFQIKKLVVIINTLDVKQLNEKYCLTISLAKDKSDNIWFTDKKKGKNELYRSLPFHFNNEKKLDFTLTLNKEKVSI